MDFVWQYVYGPSAWHKMGIFNELEYSVRSVKKYFQGEARCFVIGDKPQISQDVIHILHKRQDEDHSSREKQLRDHYHKMRAVVDNAMVGDEFVLMYDDIFLLQPTTVEDLRINWAKAEVDNIDEYLRSPIRTGTTSYKRYWRATYEGVKLVRDMKGLKTYDWETHTPRYFEKEKLAKILETGNFDKSPRILTGLYDGFYAENSQIITAEIQSDMWTHNPHIDFGKEFSKKYMNIHDNVIVSDFIEHMEQKFGK